MKQVNFIHSDFFCDSFKGRNFCGLVETFPCICFLERPLLVHELITFFWLPSGDKILYRFSLTSGCLLSRKVWWAVRIGSICRKFYRPEWTKWGEHMKMNFDYFQKQKCYKRSGKRRWKNGAICLASMFPC